MNDLTEEEKGNKIFDRGWNDYLLEREYEKRKNSFLHIQEELEDGTQIYGWKSEPPLTPFASDYAYYISDKRIFSVEECKEWTDFLLREEKTIKEKDHYSNLLELDFHLIPDLINEIYNGFKTILSVSGNTDYHSDLSAKAWFNVMRQGQGMQLHTHSHHCRNLYGFHVSIQAEDTATSYFHPEVLQVSPQGIDFLDSMDRPNRAGYLTMFPNNLPHAVRANIHETPRISIAGDITPEDEQTSIKIGAV